MATELEKYGKVINLLKAMKNSNENINKNISQLHIKVK